MEAKFKRGDRVRYIGKKRAGEPIPGKEYHITSDAVYRSPAVGADYVVGGYEYSLVATPENDDPNRYCCIKEKYLEPVNPSRIIFG